MQIGTLLYNNHIKKAQVDGIHVANFMLGVSEVSRN